MPRNQTRRTISSPHHLTAFVRRLNCASKTRPRRLACRPSPPVRRPRMRRGQSHARTASPSRLPHIPGASSRSALKSQSARPSTRAPRRYTYDFRGKAASAEQQILPRSLLRRAFIRTAARAKYTAHRQAAVGVATRPGSRASAVAETAATIAKAGDSRHGSATLVRAAARTAVQVARRVVRHPVALLADCNRWRPPRAQVLVGGCGVRHCIRKGTDRLRQRAASAQPRRHCCCCTRVMHAECIDPAQRPYHAAWDLCCTPDGTDATRRIESAVVAVNDAEHARIHSLSVCDGSYRRNQNRFVVSREMVAIDSPLAHELGLGSDKRECFSETCVCQAASATADASKLLRLCARWMPCTCRIERSAVRSPETRRLLADDRHLVERRLRAPVALCRRLDANTENLFHYRNLWLHGIRSEIWLD